MHKVLSYASTLGLPIKPNSASTVMNMVAPKYNVNCSMQFDTTDFSTFKLLFIINMVNMIVLNN